MTAMIMELAACISESIICAYSIINYFEYACEKSAKLKFFGLFSALMLIELYVTFMNANQWLAILAFIVVSTAFSIVFLKGKTLEKILISCFFYLIIIAINTAVLSVFSSVLTENYSDLIRQTGIVRLLILIITKVLFWFIAKLIIQFRHKEFLVLNKTEIAAILITFVLTFSVAYSVREMLLYNEFFPVFFVYITCCMIILNIIIIASMYKISSKNRRETEMQLIKFQLEQQEKSMIEADRQYEEISKIRHDMKNYISCAISLAGNEDYDALKNYLNKIYSDKLTSAKHYILTESRLVNAVVNQKLTDAAEKNISVKCVITGSFGIIDEMDLSILLANLLDNAVEACLRCKIIASPHISVNICSNDMYLLIKINNSCDEQNSSKKPALKTSKTDKKNHGIGLKSVADIVKKYSGTSDYSVEENEFITAIMLKIY